MPKWQVKQTLFGQKKSATGFILGDHEHGKSELINMTKNCEKSQVTTKSSDLRFFAIFANFVKSATRSELQ